MGRCLHDDRRVSGGAVRTGLVQLMTQVRPLGTLRYAVGACDHWLARTLVPVAEGLGVRVFPGPVGKDRADSELLRRAERDLPPSVDVVVIGSGDGAFARLAEAQRGLGRRVVVVGREGHISRRLRVVADEVVHLGTGVDVALAA